jgi:hypothetical protein
VTLNVLAATILTAVKSAIANASIAMQSIVINVFQTVKFAKLYAVPNAVPSVKNAKKR